MKKVVIHSDGACHGNPGPGGWSATLAFGEQTREISGGVLATTNNRMELQAAIEGLAALNEPCEVEFFTDSSYLRNGITAWIASWRRNGWRTKTKEPVKNEGLWRSLDGLVAKHKITWHWVKGHAGHAGNEKCDQLATAEILKIKEANSSQQLKAALDQFVGKSAMPVATDLFAGLK